MKTKNLFIILVLGIIMISCSPNKRERERVVNQYFNQTFLYIATFEGDTVPFMHYHAYDKYEAMKAFDEQLAESECTRKYTIQEYWVNGSKCR